MVDARTKLDIIYADVLGDINDLLSRLDKLKNDLPKASDDVATNFDNHAKRLINISSELEVNINSAITHLHEHAALAVLEAEKKAHEEVRQCVVETIDASTMSLFSSKFLEMESKHTVEIKRLNSAISEARKSLLATIEEMKIERAWSFFYCFVGSAFATLSMGFIFKVIK